MVRHSNALHLCASNAHACGDHRTAVISILVDMHDEELRDVVQSRLLCGMLTATRFACETMNTRHLQRGLDGVLSVANRLHAQDGLYLRVLVGMSAVITCRRSCQFECRDISKNGGIALGGVAVAVHVASLI